MYDILKNMNFEESLARLEEITGKLESNDLSLDESLRIFEEGIKLSRFCEEKLTEAEQKLEILKSSEIEEFIEEHEEKEIKSDKKKPKKRKELLVSSEDDVSDESDRPDSFLF